jgi:serine/threonine-protein kinase
LPTVPEASRSVDAERVLGGRYRLVRALARGGMAEVWEAKDEILGRSVAVKVLHPHLASDEAFLARFRREAIAAARLAHPNVVATYDTGLDDGVAFIVMELVHGRTVSQELAEHGAFSPGRAVHLATQVADALDYAHKAGVIHRDVKPANILVTEDDRVKVADFGIAKAAIEALEDASGGGPSDLTESGTIVGTAKYLSPEQVNGVPVDGRSDVYALGVVLYEMICGRPPFSAETDVALAFQHVSATPLSPRQVRAGIPRPLEAIVLRAMAKSPADRFATAGELHSALLSVDVGTDDSVPAPVPPMPAGDHTPPGGIPQSFARAERSWIVPVVVIVILAVTLGVVGVLFARTDTGQRLLNPQAGSGKGQVLAATAAAFDPQGDSHEHDEALGAITDGNPATTWSTEQYGNPQFGGLKSGVGFVLRLDGQHRLSQLQLSSPSHGWSAQVYVADAPKTTAPPGDWGDAVATAQADGNATFDLKGRQGGAVLVWITQLDPSGGVTVSDARLTGQ